MRGRFLQRSSTDNSGVPEVETVLGLRATSQARGDVGEVIVPVNPF